MFEPEVQIGGDKALFRTAIKAAARKAYPVDRHFAEVIRDGIGQLDLTTRAAHAFVEIIEDLRGQDVAPG